ncbi:echinoidin-like [Gigantopelta aegis]|uniref:echinoidin-like n=1 Tax=Gigantopelta aegis TaxID=1735272 RepID=UPI001B888805|nr:echinoidin-like [Gigantopelta aegis]
MKSSLFRRNDGRMWIGLTDVLKEGSFVWTDGSTLDWTNWAKGEPNSYGGDEDCVLQTDRGWIDVSCTAAPYQFVCKHRSRALPLTGHRYICADRRSDCVSRDRRFSACAKQRDFAWSQCRKTCGLC